MSNDHLPDIDVATLLSTRDDEASLDENDSLPMKAVPGGFQVDYSRQVPANRDDADLRALFGPNIMKSLSHAELLDVEITKMVDEIQLGVDQETGEFHSEPQSAKEQARAKFTFQLAKLFGLMKAKFSPSEFEKEVRTISKLLKNALHEAAKDRTEQSRADFILRLGN